MSKKVLLIGWDGADWKIIHSLIDQGLLPNLEQLINQGVSGKLATLDPPYSPILWTSIATGKRAPQHGILGFHELTPDGQHIRPVLSHSRQCKAIWNILSQKKMATHLVGWWPSHPAEPINGIAVSNFFHRASSTTHAHWEVDPHAIHPKTAASHFAALRIHPSELTPAHLYPFFPLLKHMTRNYGKAIQKVRQVLAETASLQAIFTNILRTQTWNFASVYFDGIDRICHDFMNYHPPKLAHIPQQEYELFQEVVTGIYRFHDMMLGSVMQLAGDEATILLVSDHGFKSDQLRLRKVSYEPAGIAYEHSQHGIFVAKGPLLKKDQLVHGATLLDITPTLLHLFDLPIGHDMEGVPLLSIFEAPKTPTYIPSWEDVANDQQEQKSDDFAMDSSQSKHLLQQLIDLGYVEPLPENQALALQQTKQFCDTNLARAYFDGGQLLEATALFEQIYAQSPDAPWIAFRLAVCYQMLARHQDCRALLTQLKDSHYYQSWLLSTVEASLLMGEGRYQEAISILDTIDFPETGHLAAIHVQVAQCYAKLGQREQVKAQLEQALAIDPDYAEAHQALGIWYFNQQQYSMALDHLLQAIGLDYQLATCHYYIGRSSLALGKYEAAADALKMTLLISPQNNHARELLAHTLKTALHRPTEAAQVLQAYQKYLQGTIMVVSGLPRSGTSMMMQMLEAGGIPIYTDHKRAADPSNSQGYYEHEAVKKIIYNQHWLADTKSKAVKIVAPLITHLPYNYRYKVIFMQRPLSAIYDSQMRMLARLGKEADYFSLPLMEQLEQQLKRSQEWMTRHPSLEVLYVPYQEVLQTPLEWAIKIAEFLQQPLAPLAMSHRIDPSLQHEQSTPPIKPFKQHQL
ncbi:MAG: alkaline phosphatase family protein [Bacteroidota bacterium]